MRLATCVCALALVTLCSRLESRSQSPQDLVDRAEADFGQDRIAESVADYDRLIALVPSIAPVLWQRGIGLYELGRYKECAAQFAAHATVEPVDMENAAWHFFCVARSETPGRAKAALLASGPDRRMMRTEIYDLLRGAASPADVIDAAGSYKPARFYAHMYVGLYFEALGDRPHALEHLTQAAEHQYDGLAGFMNVVAQVHLKRAGAAQRPF
jgi:lipoprotein NlpI